MSTFAIQESFMDQAAMALVGRTPLLVVKYRFMGKVGCIYVKAENFNLTGSVKDRTTLHILKNAYKRGELHPGDPIVEASSGNTGISFAALGRAMGHSITIFMPDWMSMELKSIIMGFGARVRIVSAEQGGFIACHTLAREFAAHNPRCFLPGQYSSGESIAAHWQSTGPEIRYQLALMGLRPDAFVAGVGTGGTVMGVGLYLKERNHFMRVHPLEPAESPILTSGNEPIPHRILGFADRSVPALVRLGNLDSPIGVEGGDAILMAQKLASTLGLGVGISSGANLLGAIRVQEQMGRDAIVVTLFPDDNVKYISTDLFRKETLQVDYLTPFVDLISYQAKRCLDF